MKTFICCQNLSLVAIGVAEKDSRLTLNCLSYNHFIHHQYLRWLTFEPATFGSPVLLAIPEQRCIERNCRFRTHPKLHTK